MFEICSLSSRCSSIANCQIICDRLIVICPFHDRQKCFAARAATARWQALQVGRHCGHVAVRHAIQVLHRTLFVDALVDAGQDFRPLVAIELDGASHEAAAQKYRDQVKDVIFRSGGLPLLRLKTGDTHSVASLKTLLKPYLNGVQQQGNKPR